MNKFKYYMNEIVQSISRGLWGYLVASVKIAILGFILLAIGLWWIGVDLWLLKALGIAIVDIIPVLGSGIVMIPWALIHLFLGNSTLAWQIGVLYIVLVVIRQIAEPIITGNAIGVRPIYTFFSTVVCIVIFGPIGAVLGAVVAVILKAIFSIRSFQQNEYE